MKYIFLFLLLISSVHATYVGQKYFYQENFSNTTTTPSENGMSIRLTCFTSYFSIYSEVRSSPSMPKIFSPNTQGTFYFDNRLFEYYYFAPYSSLVYRSDIQNSCNINEINALSTFDDAINYINTKSMQTLTTDAIIGSVYYFWNIEILPDLICPTLYNSPSDSVPEQFCNQSYFNQYYTGGNSIPTASWLYEDFMGANGCCIYSFDSCPADNIFNGSQCIPDPSLNCFTADQVIRSLELKCYSETGAVGVIIHKLLENDGCVDFDSLSYDCNEVPPIIENPLNDDGSLSDEYLDSLKSDTITPPKTDNNFEEKENNIDNYVNNTHSTSSDFEKDSLKSDLKTSEYTKTTAEATQGLLDIEKTKLDIMNNLPDPEETGDYISGMADAVVDGIKAAFPIKSLSEFSYSQSIPFFDYRLTLPNMGIDISLFSSSFLTNILEMEIQFFNGWSIIDLIRFLIYYTFIFSAFKFIFRGLSS
jgi:hypothetical protein